MCKALQPLLGSLCVVLIYDILVFSKNNKSHLSDVKHVLQSLRKCNLSIKLEKCNFFQTMVEYLGHTISRDGISYKFKQKLKGMERPMH